MRRDSWPDSSPDFPDHMTRLLKLKLSARLCNLGLNPDAVRPLARLMSRLSRPYVQTFQTQTVGATLQFGSKSGCSATLGATHVQTFQTVGAYLSRIRLLARICNLGLNQDVARSMARLMSSYSRPFVQTFQTQTLGATLQFWSNSGCGAIIGVTLVQTFQTLCPVFTK